MVVTTVAARRLRRGIENTASPPAMTRNPSPAEWFKSTFPVTTVAGVQVVYSTTSHKAQYYSVEWLVETFGEQVITAEDPHQTLVEECDRNGYSDLRDLFTAQAG